MKRPLLILFMSLLTLSAAAGQPVWWGYWNSTIDAVPAMSCQGTNSFGLRLNAMNNARLAGTQAHGLRFCISDKSAVERAWAWVSVSKFSWGSTQPDVVLHEVDVTTLSDMQHDGRPAEILFPEPVALLGTQIVSGTNYRILCSGTTVTADPVTSLYVVDVYEDLQGAAEVKDIQLIDLTKYAGADM